jgi:EAL domain-containing protein (putative c-di-GMP-specific phosphodiesterase class I)
VRILLTGYSDLDTAIQAINQGRVYACLMDDFGVGYSSLGLLKQLPFDIVKLDQSFIVDLLTDSSSALLTRAIINMAHDLEKEVIAEGVETAEQAAHLL